MSTVGTGHYVNRPDRFNRYVLLDFDKNIHGKETCNCEHVNKSFLGNIMLKIYDKKDLLHYLFETMLLALGVMSVPAAR